MENWRHCYDEDAEETGHLPFFSKQTFLLLGLEDLTKKIDGFIRFSPNKRAGKLAAQIDYQLHNLMVQ